jgi:hypothetical protein
VAESFVELRRFFEHAIRASFSDLAVRDEPAATYLADLLTRFARTESLYPAGRSMPRLETVVDMLLDAQAVWQPESPHFEPQGEIAIRRHIGDYTLFMLGIFRERVERVASTSYFIVRGKQAYRFVSEHARARASASAPPYGRLADHFEHYAGALDYARRVHFFGHPQHPFFSLG